MGTSTRIINYSRLDLITVQRVGSSLEQPLARCVTSYSRGEVKIIEKNRKSKKAERGREEFDESTNCNR